MKITKLEMICFCIVTLCIAAVAEKEMRPKKDFIEAEDLRISAQSRIHRRVHQNTKNVAKDKWSQNSYVFFCGKEFGDWVEFELEAKNPGYYDIGLYLTKSYDFGEVQISINDQIIEPRIDLLAPKLSPAEPLLVRNFFLEKKINTLRIQSIPSDDLSKVPWIAWGLDAIELHATTPS